MNVGQTVCIGARGNDYGTIIRTTEHVIYVRKEGMAGCLRLDPAAVRCAHARIDREDYLNPCASAGCKLNGVHTYHLGCGSQYKEFCADCGELLYDSAVEEIESVVWEEVEYRCTACVDEVQPGHFACGNVYSIPA